MWHHICYKIFHVDGQARDYYYSLPQPLCCLQIQKTWQWKPINGYSSAVQPVVITLLDGIRQVILMPSERIGLYTWPANQEKTWFKMHFKSNDPFLWGLCNEALNKSTFYCAAYERHHQGKSCSCDKGGRCYSRPALLTGNHMFELLHWIFSAIKCW